MCLLQCYKGGHKTQELVRMLLQGDDGHLPAFCQALVETGQSHISEQLGYQGGLS